MSLTAFFALLGGLLVLAFVANRLAQRTRVPDAVVLILVGVILGPILGLVHAGQFENVTRGFGTLALILILFEGGLELDARETLRHLGGGLMLSWMAYVLSVALVAYVAKSLLPLTWRGAMLVGAVLGCVSSTIMLPVLQQIPLRKPVKLTLLVETSVGDVLAVLTVGALLNIDKTQTSLFKNLFGGFVFELGAFRYVWDCRGHSLVMVDAPAFRAALLAGIDLRCRSAHLCRWHGHSRQRIVGGARLRYRPGESAPSKKNRF